MVMTEPLSAHQMVAALKAEGVHVAEYKDWELNTRTSSARPWGPVNGVMIHHTAGSNSLTLCFKGRSDLPGPLCHTHLSKAGTATMVGYGHCNHAGRIAANAHQAVVLEDSYHPYPDAVETVNGNQRYYGLEIENLGNGKDPYPSIQYDQAVRWAAALCRAHGWSADSVIGHKEGTRRKIDPSFDMGEFRAAVNQRLMHLPSGDQDQGDNVPEYMYFERSKGVTLNPGEWYTVTWDRVWTPANGWESRNLAQTLLGGDEFVFDLDFAVRVAGLVKGQEIQMRVARNHKKPGEEWARAKSWPISSPVHDGGRLHATHTWGGHLPETDDNRLVTEILVLGDNPVDVDEFVVSLRYWRI